MSVIYSPSFWTALKGAMPYRWMRLGIARDSRVQIRGVAVGAQEARQYCARELRESGRK